MPQVNATPPPRKVVKPPTAQPGSILSQAIAVGDIADDYIKMVLYGRNRCLAGDTPIRYTVEDAEGREQNGKGGTLELLFKRFNGILRPGKGYYQRPQTVGSLYCVSSVTDEGRVFKNRIEGVTDSGRREVLRVTTASGKSIKATADHRFLTETGYVELGCLSAGMELMVNPRVRRYKGGTKPRVRRKQLCVKNHATGGMKVINGCVYYRISLTHAVYEANENGMSLQDYVSFLNKKSVDEVHNLWHVPKGAEIHHLDENPLNDTVSNLFLSTSGGEHQRTFHHDAIRDRFGIYAELDAIVAIEEAGVENTYDIQVAGPYHNFEAGGILVHNSGKTTLSCQFEKPLLLVSFEPANSGGAKSVKLIDGITYIHIVARGKKDHRGVVQQEAASTRATALARELKQACPFKTVVLDTVTSYQDLILQEILNLPDVPEQLNWGMVSEDEYRMRSERTREALRPFIDVEANTIFCAQEKDHNPPQDRKSRLIKQAQLESFFAADLGGATVKWLHDACDYIAQMYQDKEVKLVSRPGNTVAGKKLPDTTEEVETGKIVRRLRTLYSPNFAAGFRTERPETIPEYIEAVTPAEMYAKMMKLITGK